MEIGYIVINDVVAINKFSMSIHPSIIYNLKFISGWKGEENPGQEQQKLGL